MGQQLQNSTGHTIKRFREARTGILEGHEWIAQHFFEWTCRGRVRKFQAMKFLYITNRLSSVGLSSNGSSDVASFRLSQHRTGIVYLLPNNTIQLQIGSTSSNGDAQGILGNAVSPPVPSSISSNHFSAASVGEKAIKLYIYYQANETSLAEISFDTDTGVWSRQPSMIKVP